MQLQLVWFKRDLRVDDHRPLVQAAARGPVVGLYIHEPAVLHAPQTDPCHVAFILDALAELKANLEARGMPLLIEHGEATEVLDRLHERLPFGRIWSHEETGLDVTFARDKAVARWCADRRVPWTELPQFGVHRRLRDRKGWAKRWTARMSEAPAASPQTLPGPPGVSSSPSLTLAELGLAPSAKTGAQAAGEAEAHRVLRSFLRGRGRGYERAMSSPNSAWDGCSRLSAHLAYGTISMRRVFQRTELVRRESQAYARRGDRDAAALARSLEAFGERLRWHCHFTQKLESEPAIEFRNMHRAFDGMRNEEPDTWSDSERHGFEAWSHGQTGFPMVDACMRCLHATGWINFRMRAMLVSVLTHDLWLHWRPGADVLARHFLDFEPGIHIAQFQMQAGTTGIAALRIYDPAKQVRDHDPQGAFIRRWVPELRGVPAEHLPQPERMPMRVQQAAGCKVGRDYPAPLVDHVVARARALRQLKARQQSAIDKRETERVLARHGSRRPPNARTNRRR